MLKVLVRTAMRRGGLALVVALAAVAWTPGAHAQYRNNGIFFEAGVQSYEFLPYTVAAFGTTKGAQLVWDETAKRTPIPKRPSLLKPCTELKPYSFPCVNNWFGLTDGIYAGGGFQRVVGDLLVDVSESPLLESIVISYRALVGASGTLAGGAHIFPVFVVHQEPGLRWNILDEKFRPYVGMNLGFNLFVDPFGLAGRVRNNQLNCGRQENTANAVGTGGCVDGPGSVSLNAFSPQSALWYLTSFPMLLSVRPEAGFEYFFYEDISVQWFASPNWYVTFLPQFLARAPFHGFSARTGANVVFYF